MEELDLKDLLLLFWEKRVQIILIVAICAVIGVIYTLGFVTPKYESSTTLLLVKNSEVTTDNSATGESSTSLTVTDVTLNSKLVSTYSELIKRKTILRQVISNLGISELDEDDIRKNVKVSAVEDTELIEITVTNTNAVYAAKIANEIANVFTQKVSEIYNINNVNIVDVAEVAEGPSNINHVKDVTMFVGIGIVIAAAYVLIASMLDNTVKCPEDIEKVVELPVLASIPLYDFENTKAKGGKR